MRATLTSVVLSATIGLAGCAAQPGHAARLADVSVYNRDTGQRLPVHRHHGKLYVAGTPGQRYAIEVRNRDGNRVLAVMSVDGVNILTGETASPTQSGYVLTTGVSYAINGWRKSSSEVAQFVFTALPDSYAARTDRPDNVGVIGLALFKEKVAPPPVLYDTPASAPVQSPYAESEGKALSRSEPARKRSAATAERDSAGLAKEESRLGTGHGQREQSRSSWTDFERARSAPDEVVAIYYDSTANLIARGVLASPRPSNPQPFPALVYVPDPR